MGSIYFLSDLHLRAGEEDATLRFQRFLREKVRNADTLVLGGDIFDLFVGDKKIFRERFSSILEVLRELSDRGAKVHYLEGNHDFHIAQVFSGSGNIFVHERGFEIAESGKRFWIDHGDEIDRKDYGYLFLRAITRSRLFQWLLAALPDSALAKIGNWSSKQSRKYHSEDRQNSSAQERTRSLFRDYAKTRAELGYAVVFLGHSHLADYCRILQGDRVTEYFNLGFSSEKLLYGCYEGSGESMKIQEYP